MKTVYDYLKEMSIEEMAKFLYIFAQETIDQFANFILPSEEGMQEFLSRTYKGEEE